MHQSIPDTDKCIEISKVYNVSIEWLLGIKENRNEDNISKDQLETIEKVIKRYSKSKSKHNVIIISCIFIILLLSGVLLYETIQYIQYKQDIIQSDIDEITNKVNEQNDYLIKLEELLDKQKDFIINNCTFDNYDLENNKAKLKLNITPKEYQKGMQIQITIDNGSNIFTADAIEKENRQFIVEKEIVLSDILLIGANIKINSIEKLVYVDKIENTQTNTYLKSYDYELYGFEKSGNKLKEFSVANKISKNKFVNDLDINNIKSYVFINNVYQTKMNANIEYDEITKYYTSNIKIDASNFDREDLYVEIIDVINDSENRTYVLGGTKFSIHYLNGDKMYTEFLEGYQVDKSFRWERYE